MRRDRAILLLILGFVSGALCCPASAENPAVTVEIHGPAGDSSGAVQVPASDIRFLPVEGNPVHILRTSSDHQERPGSTLSLSGWTRADRTRLTPIRMAA